MPVMQRWQALRESWVRARNAADLQADWSAASRLLSDAIDEDLDHELLVRFAERVHILADKIDRREPLISGPGLALHTALKVVDVALIARCEPARTSEIIDVLFRLEALDDDDDDDLDSGLHLMVVS